MHYKSGKMTPNYISKKHILQKLGTNEIEILKQSIISLLLGPFFTKRSVHIQFQNRPNHNLNNKGV